VDDIKKNLSAPVLFISKHVLDDGMGLLYDFVLCQFSECQFLTLNDSLKDVDGMTIQSTVVHIVVVRYVLDKVEPLEKLNEPLILLYYG
jgi:hypothetical protein